MTHRLALLVPLALSLACAGSRGETSAARGNAAAGPRGPDVSAMDRSVEPGEDFYAFANGSFLRSFEIPPDRARSGAFDRVAMVVDARSRAIVDEASKGAAPGTDARKIADLYASFMDEAGIEAKGLAPLEPALRRIAAIADAKALATELGATVRADVDIFNCTSGPTNRPLALWVEQGLSDPSRNVAYLVQGGLGMPDRSYYLDETPRLAEARAKYAAHLERLFALAGASEPAERARRALALETRIARSHASRADSHDVTKGNNPWARADFERRAPGLDWGAFLAAAGLEGQQSFIVWQPSAVTGLAAAAKEEPLAAWKDYLTARALDRAAPLLPRAFALEAFSFHGTALTGVTQQRERWRRGLTLVDAVLGEPLGKMYVERHFPPEAKAEVKGMVENIRAALGRRIDALDWMTPATKGRAKAKLASLEVGIGYPDRWNDWSGLEIVKGDLLGNVERAELFNLRREIAKLGKTPDRGEWCMLPHTVNAVNLPVRNALNFPAGIMEPPFYDRNATPAVKYAAIGAVIGHEISHSFDDMGALFDEQGRLANWWTPEDFAHFQGAGAKLAAQYDRYRPFPDAAVNGKLTLGENIADLAGIAAAYEGWRASLSGPAPAVDGLSGDQQFFVSYAQAWQVKYREPELRRRLVTDVHAPGQYRALTVRNLDPWYAAFDVKPGQALYLPPEERVRVW